MRVAYVGPAPDAYGSVAGAARHVLSGLLDLGHQVDCFVARVDAPLPADLTEREGFQLVDAGSGFEYGKWYSRTELTKFVSGQALRALAERRLARQLAARHARRAYDVVYQRSHIEVFGLGRGGFPPLVVHPDTHAAGELRWFLNERDIARRCEPVYRRVAARAILSGRAAAQKRHTRVPDGFICLSRAFQRVFCADCDVDVARTRVVPNPIDLTRFRPQPGAEAAEERPVRILFVSRISVRKGVEDVVALSHRLADLRGSVTLEVVGDRTQWSDYRELLRDLDAGVASYRGGIAAEEMPELISNADILLQPSRYEPFGLTAAEALASGVPVVVSDAVGAAEDVAEGCARIVPVGDVRALEQETRRLVDEIRRGGRESLAALARGEAERLFDPAKVAASMAGALEELTLPHEGPNR